MKLTDLDLGKRVECIASDLLAGNDRLVREQERKQITSVSRSQAHLLEKEGRFPKRIPIGKRAVAWSYLELTNWLKQILEDQRQPQQQSQPTLIRIFAHLALYTT